MAIDKDIQQILNELKSDFNDKVKHKVVEKMKIIESETIEEVVYNGTYQPTYYDRRMNDGGLSDVRNMQATQRNTKDGVEIEIENLTKGNDAYSGAWGYTNGYIQDIVVEGKGYGYGLDDVIGERDFITATQDRVDSGNELEEVVEKMLKSLGYDFE